MEIFGALYLLPCVFWIVSSQATLHLSYSIRENLQPRVIVGYVGRDSNLTTITTYKFVENANIYQYFEIEQTSGVLSTVLLIDREGICPFQPTCVKRLKVAALSASLVNTITIDVNILDVNDNSPSFPVTTMTKEINENLPVNTTITLVGATDPDMGVNNSVQSYEIVPDYHNLFALDILPKLDGTSDVNLRVLQSLDREDKDSYELYIVAKDGGNPVRTGMMSLTLNVTDINDNRPIFDKEQYDITITENIPVSQVFLTVSATDPDFEKNGEVHYKFSSRQSDSSVLSLFDISTVPSPLGNYGEIFVKAALTVIPERPYRIVVEASDSGTSKVLSSQAIVNINVSDINNNDPVITVTFTKGTDFALVKENSANGTKIAFVHVDDADHGLNKIATCSIKNNFFRLETFAENEFSISVHGDLDRESIDEHVITVFCHDRGTPSRNATYSFIVQIEDENDNSPIFSNSVYKATIFENKTINTYITKVSATDIDQGSNAEVKYELGIDAQPYFLIEENTGIIKSKQVFDREQKSFYTILVLAKDSGIQISFTSSAFVEIQIEDENDNVPKFSELHYKFETLEENQNLVKTIGRVEATDPDAGDNGVVTFHLPQQFMYLPFSLTTDGYLRTTDRLDREAQPKYEFYIIARDLGLNPQTSTATVTVTLLDINDNAPVFKFPNSTNNSVSLPYLANVDTLVTTLVAVDSDIGENSTLEYKFVSGNEEDLFYMDSYSGEMFLKRKISVHEIKSYKLTIAAEDHGNPQQSTRDDLWIHVKFVNVSTISNFDNTGAGQNIIIAIVIGAITVILSILIIITICIIRKMDSRKHIYSAKSAEHMRIVDLKRGSSNRSSSSKGSQDRIMDVYEIPNKKEVSFSFDEEQENTLSMTLPSTMSSGSGMVTFKSNSSLNTQSPNTHSKNHIREESLTEQGQQQLNRMTSLRVQQQYLQQNGREKWRQSQQPQRQLSPLGKRNSGHEESDVSTTSTTDSGNGGSDEDVRNQADSACRPGSVSPRQHSTTDSAISRDFSAGKPSLSTFGHPHNSGMSTFPRNPQGKTIMFHNVRDPVYNNIHDGAKLQRLHSDNIHPHKHYDVPRVPFDSHGDVSYQGDSNLQRANRNLNLTRSYDDTLSDSCVSPRDDDDRATTTSGSYTVNPDDLCTEIDELFFRDRGDTVV